ncbi:hypothetical protein KI387_037761, partial [Taxus chinensis]
LSAQAIVDERYCSETDTTLTVWNKSLVFTGEGFTVFDSNGNLLFRLDTYDYLILMDAQGKPLLTLFSKVKRKCRSREIMLGKDVFSLCIECSFDQAFIMGIIIILNQIGIDIPLVRNLVEEFRGSEAATTLRPQGGGCGGGLWLGRLSSLPSFICIIQLWRHFPLGLPDITLFSSGESIKHNC